MFPLRRSVVLAWVCSALLAGGATAGEPPSGPLTLLTALSDGPGLSLPALDPAVPAPGSELGYEIGTRFSRWPAIRHYLEALAAASDRVAIWPYGATYEDRPLLLLAISSPENLSRLEKIRQRNLELALPSGDEPLPAGDPALAGPAIVWLGYGVHGNETSSTEAAMAVAYVLAAGGDPWPELLRDVVVLIDPLANPDGRERYVHFYDSHRGRVADTLVDSAEHREPWPGGRQNHYLVDLNRDWAWGSQIETRHRLAEYRRWEPHVVVDLHEMGADATYFFPPSAAPVNARIDPLTLGWLERFGHANAAAFDARGWIYYSGENFDLYYPGYGDSYPSLRGAVGMTYEVAGHAAAGLGLELGDGTLLTLPDRIARHATSSLATVRTASENRRELLRDFAAARRRNLSGETRSYLWEATEHEAAWIATTLERHGIDVRRLSAAAPELPVRPGGGGDAAPRTFPAGTWVAGTNQPLGSLLRSLMDQDLPMPSGFLEEQRQRLDENRAARFFDITAWSLPLAGNVETWIHDGSIAGAVAGSATDPPPAPGAVGFLAAPAGLAGYRFAAALLDGGVRFRLALSPLTTGGVRYPAGTLFIPTRGGNRRETGDLVVAAATRAGVRLDPVATSFSEAGISLGSESMPTVRGGRIGLVSGAGVSATSFGFLWHLLDRELELPYHRLAVDSLGKIDLRSFDVLILPDGSGYSAALDESAIESLTAWVEGGGILVAVGDSVGWLQERELTRVVSRNTSAAADDEEVESTVAVPGRAGRVAEHSLDTPGAAVNTAISTGHPLAVGLPRPPRALLQGSTILEPSGDPQRDLLTVASEEPIAAGFAWPEARARLAGSLLVGTEDRGEGKIVVFLSDPCFRLFWRATTPLFLNAVIYGPSLQDKGLF